MIFRIFAASDSTSRPATDAEPDVFLSRVVRTLIVVLLPAPFGPRNPKNSPSCTWNEIPSTAFVPSAYTTTRSLTSIISANFSPTHPQESWRGFLGSRLSPPFLSAAPPPHDEE